MQTMGPPARQEAWIVEPLARDVSVWVQADRKWISERCGTLICPRCYHLLPHVFPTTLDVPLIQLPAGVSYSGVFRTGVAVIRHDLLRLLERYLVDCAFGTCTNPAGERINGYHVIYFKRRIEIRGDADTHYFRCHCGSLGTATEMPYVLRCELNDYGVFQDAVSELYVRETIAREIPWRQFPDIRPQLIPIRDDPLPDDPFPPRIRA